MIVQMFNQRRMMEAGEIVRHWFGKAYCHGNVGETEKGLKK
jgi:hypothetical protein